MRITIDIDEGGGPTRTTAVDGEATAVETTVQQQAAPPADLAARAAAIGALSGGPAPSGPPDGTGAGVPGFQQSAPGTPGMPARDPSAGGPRDIPAGAAPGGAEATPAIEIEG